MNSRVLNKLFYFIFFLSLVFALTACTQAYTVESPRIRIYIPQYADFTYVIDGKVQVKHSYLFGPGVKPCGYVGELAESYMQDGDLLYPYQNAQMKNFFEKNGHIYQGQANRDTEVLGYPYISRLGGELDPETGNEKTYVTELWSFDYLCHSRIGSSEYTIYLQKSSSLSIAQDIEQKKKLLSGAWKPYAHWDLVTEVKRGNNTWTVFKKWNRADYLSDAAEYWYLSLGDDSYYYKVVFTYKSAMRASNDEQYLRSRAMIDHILDSFEVRELTPEESAAIVNATSKDTSIVVD